MREVKEQGFKNDVFQDLNYARIDEIGEIEKIELRFKRLNIKKVNYFF